MNEPHSAHSLTPRSTIGHVCLLCASKQGPEPKVLCNADLPSASLLLTETWMRNGSVLAERAWHGMWNT